MIKKVTRTIKMTTVFAKQIGEKDGKATIEDLEPFKTHGTPSLEKIEEHYKPVLKEGYSLMVKEVKKEDKLMGLDLDKFIELAEEIVKEEDKTEEKEPVKAK
jgi:hypothetical protein